MLDSSQQSICTTFLSLVSKLSYHLQKGKDRDQAFQLRVTHKRRTLTNRLAGSHILRSVLLQLIVTSLLHDLFVDVAI